MLGQDSGSLRPCSVVRSCGPVRPRGAIGLESDGSSDLVQPRGAHWPSEWARGGPDLVAREGCEGRGCGRSESRAGRSAGMRGGRPRVSGALRPGGPQRPGRSARTPVPRAPAYRTGCRGIGRRATPVVSHRSWGGHRKTSDPGCIAPVVGRASEDERPRHGAPHRAAPHETSGPGTSRFIVGHAGGSPPPRLTHQRRSHETRSHRAGLAPRGSPPRKQRPATATAEPARSGTRSKPRPATPPPDSPPRPCPACPPACATTGSRSR